MSFFFSLLGLFPCFLVLDLIFFLLPFYSILSFTPFTLPSFITLRCLFSPHLLSMLSFFPLFGFLLCLVSSNLTSPLLLEMDREQSESNAALFTSYSRVWPPGHGREQGSRGLWDMRWLSSCAGVGGQKPWRRTVAGEEAAARWLLGQGAGFVVLLMEHGGGNTGGRDTRRQRRNKQWEEKEINKERRGDGKRKGGKKKLRIF